MTFAELDESRDIIEALPVGIAIYDNQRRLVLSNAVLRDTIGVAPSTYRPGSSFDEHMRVAAHRGLFGPGDPDEQAASFAALDLSQPRRFRRRLPDGRSFDAHYTPLPCGGLMICVIDVTASAALREDAERTATRIHAAFSGLRVGVAVFTPHRTLALHNACFTALLGLSALDLYPGMPLDDLLHAIMERGEFAGPHTETLLAEQIALDRTRPSAIRGVRGNGAVLDITSDPLPDGGWSMTVADVSALARAEDEARRRAGLLDTILRQLPHGVTVYGPDLRITMVNEAYNRIMDGDTAAVGDTQEELIRRRANAGEYGPGDPEAHVRQQLAFDVAIPQARSRRRPNGRIIERKTAPLPDGGHISVVSDVTDLVEMHAELERNAELMASIVNHIPHGVSVYDRDSRLRLVNAAYDRMMEGAPLAIGDTVDQVIERRAKAGEYGEGNPDELAAIQRSHAQAMPTLRRRRRPNGTTIDIRTAKLPDGGHISVSTDVTQLVEAEAGLRRTTAEMAAMLANIAHGIVLWGPDGRIIAANQVAADLVGAPPGHFAPGRSLAQLIADAKELGNLGDGAMAEERARRLITQDRTISHLDQRLTRTGRILEVRSDPIPGGGFVTTYTDVTQIREAADALRIAKSAAEAANTAKSRFLAAMSTELRSPIAVIQAELASLARAASQTRTRPGGEGIDPAHVQHASQVAAGAARRLLTLIDSVLDVARLEAGRFDLVDELVDIPLLIRACLAKADSIAAAGEVALLVELPDTLPCVRADRGRLRQTLGHLIANAIRFTPALGNVNIGARVESETGDLVISVTDTGCGIDVADLERIFEPFSLSADGAHAGLGLYLGRTLMRAHGGDLVLRSTTGEGTTASLRIPASRVVPAHVTAA